MKRILIKINDIISRRELIPKVVSLILAVLLWAYIASTKIGETKFRVPIETKNLPPTMVISKMQTNYITVSLKGKKEQINNFNIKNFKAYVNLEDAVVKDNENYTISVTKQQLPDSIEYSLSRNSVSISIEKKMSKSVRVVPTLTGKLKDGYVLGNIKITPEYMTIYGAKSLLDEINEIKTKAIPISNETKKIVKDISFSKIKDVEFNDTTVNVIIPILDSSNLYTFNKELILKDKDDDFSFILMDKKSIKLFVRTNNESIEISEKDFDVYVELDSFNYEEKLKNSPENQVTNEYKIKVLIKSHNDNIKNIYTIPEKILIKIKKID